MACRTARLHLLWVVAVNTGMLRISRGRVAPGPLTLSADLPYRAVLGFWDGVVMDILDRADDDLTGSPVIDDHLAEMLATLYAVREGLSTATLVKGILQSHRVACGAGPAEMRTLTGTLPAQLESALSLLGYCGLVETSRAGRPRLTPLGMWAVRQDLIREGHDAPTGAEVAVFADLGAPELVEEIMKGSAAPSAVTMWLESRHPEAAARELVKVAASGTAGRRGVAGAILEELGPEAEALLREALSEPAMWRYAASWLHIRDLSAPALTPPTTPGSRSTRSPRCLSGARPPRRSASSTRSNPARTWYAWSRRWPWWTTPTRSRSSTCWAPGTAPPRWPSPHARPP